MNRAAPSRNLLRRDPDAQGLLGLVEEHCVGAGLEIHAYCLLDRHYHLLARGYEAEIRRALASLEAATERRFREARDVAGPLFPAEPHVRPVLLGRHMAVVSRYVHLNPVLAGLAWRPEDWPHSSYRGYLGDPDAPRWLRTATVLGPFGSIGARHRYRAFVREGLDPGARDALGRPRWGSAFARGSLEEDLAWRVEPLLEWRTAIASPAGPGRPVPLEVLARAVAAAFDVRAESVRTWRGGGGPSAALARGAFVHAARSLGNYGLREVAAWMRYAAPGAAVAAAARFERASRADPTVAATLDRALRALASHGSPIASPSASD